MSSSRYTVRRLGWYQPPHGDAYTRWLPGAEPVAAFDTFDDAEMYRRELEAAARPGENPFRFGGASVFFQSSLDGPRLHDWLMDAGIDPPASELRHADWRAWWSAFAHTWSADQLAHAWAGLDKVRFFDVAAASGAAHLLVLIGWGRSAPGTLTASVEGGRVEGAYRSAARAEAERTARDRALTGGYDYRGARYFDYEHRAGYDPLDQNVTLARATFFEVLAVPSDVPRFAGGGHLVQRRSVLAPAQNYGWHRRSPADARVPVALFATRAAAVEALGALAADAQRAANPFAFVEPGEGVATNPARADLARLRLPLPVPATDRRAEWLEWYDLCQDELSDDQRAAVWNLCDRPLFEVRRVEVSDE